MQTVIKRLGLQDYQQTWQKMQALTLARNKNTADEIWIVEHPPVYTLGLNGKREHLLNINDIPVMETDRGGQVTYHAPGQLVVYLLLDIERLKIGVRDVVTALEQAMVATLAQYGIKAIAKPEAPGVYVNHKKIGSVGLRVKKGCCYHGLSLNNNMDLSPFNNINTCGYTDLAVTQLADHNVIIKTYELAVPVLHHILQAIKK
ncbi:MAG: lipoyl(octanoyl) transferase LipB [Methylococcales symbiont of Hymedesmia sp. n. MRB-2018]|nr:MAG: lipoyl(octanoyl) transferase LipB [Methylococcales symbiont of Hymedesmia sp. n. MRB-2018]KAF3983419.1 MAG: lipoyl(octanoyl) transferase LipB [Methylococcales symbiont of Hymedesmia sp. n. MRB-2018]